MKIKKLEFTTGKGRFLIIELTKEAKHIEYARDSHGYYLLWHDGTSEFVFGSYSHGQITLSENPKDSVKLIGKVKELSEEQASEIVDEPRITGIGQYFPPYDLTGWLIEDKPMGKCYSKTTSVKYFDYKKENYSLINSIESLHSLIKSNGWYLENTFEKFADECGCEEAESRTFHNPVIFKIK